MPDPRVRELYVRVGERVRRVRLERGLTQAELGRLIALARTSVSNLEKGRQQLLLHTLYAIADALQVSPLEFLPSTLPDPRPVRGRAAVEQAFPGDLTAAEQEWIVAVATAPSAVAGEG